MVWVFFSADELLLNNGNNFVTYYGYDHTRQKTSTKPSFDDFFTEQDEYGNFTRPVAPFEPIYTEPTSWTNLHSMI